MVKESAKVGDATRAKGVTKPGEIRLAAAQSGAGEPFSQGVVQRASVAAGTSGNILEASSVGRHGSRGQAL